MLCGAAACDVFSKQAPAESEYSSSATESSVAQSSSFDEAITYYTVTFYQDDGATVIDTQTVAEGGKFTLPTVRSSRNLLGYYKWEGGDWSEEYITLDDFADPAYRTVHGNIKLKAKYEWTGISPA